MGNVYAALSASGERMPVKVGKFNSFSRLATDGRGTTLSRRQHDKKSDEAPVRVSILRDRRFNGYLRVKLPHVLDTEVEAIVTAYMTGSPSVRDAIVGDVHGRPAEVLSAYGQRMASVAVRTGGIDALRRGVVAIGLAEGRLDDPRNNLFVLAAVNDSASLLGTTLQAVIDDVKGLLPPAGVAGLQQFALYADSEKSIEAYGIRRCGSGQDFFYA
ncbi:hypothetical protein [Streptomyces coeruleorubidus]|uniref:Uncharacterized protein n=1 Tax=Streptomyces coeruleorubidus TaxID=116188 RepID=A0ABZ0KR84_STRC4|nr:hypothetical protein [Streptomyces coeruleorubidus]WOT40585.1 hypothetical protein R5U08_41540 [Streptomyces coeruleorubidus]